ncbi:PREDICTED: apolipoprotein D-like [Rhagoletis zephyria]|uniref:apolipoprotein D-like n=1 Tax=Rhagoletis zephyria TaxID=28612 RepID=UPI0008116BF6|nr:PREDICTED: apolipoprotein D-like [Rhagoletis zephyria]
MQKQQLNLACLSVILLASTQMVASQVFNLGRCPRTITTVQDFDASKYLGLWNEYAKYPFIFEAGGRCIQAQYGALAGDQVSVLNTQTTKLNVRQSIEGIATVEGPGKLSVRFNGLAALSGDSPYWVLSTDYTTYAVVYSCTNLGIAHTKVVWILTRDRIPSPAVVKKAEDAIVAQNLPLSPLEITDQLDCE